MSLSARVGLPAERARFDEDGYVVVRGAFAPREMDVLGDTIERSAAMSDRIRWLRERAADGGRPSFQTLFVSNDTGGCGRSGRPSRPRSAARRGADADA